MIGCLYKYFILVRSWFINIKPTKITAFWVNTTARTLLCLTETSSVGDIQQKSCSVGGDTNLSHTAVEVPVRLDGRPCLKVLLCQHL